jgi:hypothetical protein
MYLPKSKYVGDRYTAGEEWAIAGETTPYVGYYFTAWSGKSFTGRRPGDGSNSLLERYTGVSQTANLQIDKTTYDIISNDIQAFALKKTLPVPIHYPVPSRQDYLNLSFTRYLARERLTSRVFEINLDTYTALNNNDTRYYYPGYQTVKLDWVLVGPLEDTKNGAYIVPGAASRNAKSRELADKKLPGAAKFLNNLAQFVI